MNILTIKLLVARVIYSIHILIYKRSNNKILIDADVDYWCQRKNIQFKSKTKRLIYMLKFCPQFRNLFYFRCRGIWNIVQKLCPKDPTISIASDMNEICGGGVYFEHAICTRIACRSMGIGCTFRQLTTIGVKSEKRHEEKPIIGNYVDFGANCTCIGAITIGNYAVIGAGAVVVKDVPERGIVAGNPARIVGYVQRCV